jgi:hypothetical protein
MPSGRVLRLARGEAVRTQKRPRAGARLFDEALSVLLGGGVVLRDERGASVDARSLALCDFHLLRAVLVRASLATEEPVTFPCRNCEAKTTVHPCAALELAPWIDGELGDEELDATLPFGEPHEIPPVPLVGRRTARAVTLAPRSVGEALPLFAALGRGPLRVVPALVRAMGVEALGDEREPRRIAAGLADCSDEAFAAVTDCFLAAHYPRRLGAAVACEACGARNDVDAPYEREFEPSSAHHDERLHGEAAEAFPDLDAFDAAAHEGAERAFGGRDDVVFVVEGGVPACDDGGEPLLGSYVPAFEGDMASPSRPAEITVFFRTFRSMWEEDPYDWRAELEETVEHELEHHEAALRGHDEVDEEERRVIATEAVRLVGQRELARRSARGLVADMGEFFRRTWALWIVLLIVAFVSLFLPSSCD